ncbi:hypothetical protein [Sutcliffiella halmapala]|uniref:hypothetical protein n=1 Tax=Sutcliffiella halmapala TaxID=79882 RepID=UPI00099560EB|nr:hypothetical protein [Sutcliffiella halmapala]
MSEFDFGEEHLKFMFERGKVNENLAEVEKFGGKNIKSAEDLIKQAQWFEIRLNRYVGSLEMWMEGTKRKLDKIETDEE